VQLCRREPQWPAAPAGIPQPHADSPASRRFAPAAAGRPHSPACCRLRSRVPLPLPPPNSQPVVAMSPFAQKKRPSSRAAGEGLIGADDRRLPNRQLSREGRLGSAYAAVQISINRPVGLKVLDPERARRTSRPNPALSRTPAQGHVQHRQFSRCTRRANPLGASSTPANTLMGKACRNMAASRQALDEITALKVMRVVAEGFVYLTSHNIPHRSHRAQQGLPRHGRTAASCELAVQVADEVYSTRQEIPDAGPDHGSRLYREPRFFPRR
jgi:hypothetical protein